MKVAQLPSTIKRSLLGIAAAVLALSACGDSDGGDDSAGSSGTTESIVAQEDEAVSAEDQPTTGDAAESEPDSGEPSNSTDDGDSESSDQSADFEPEIDPAEFLTLPAGPVEFELLGGIQFELPVDASVIDGRGCLIIEVPGYEGPSPFGPSITIGLINFRGRFANTSISGIDDWLTLYDGEPEPAPTGESLSSLGRDLAEYSFSGSYLQGPPPDGNFLNCSTTLDVLSEMAFLPSGFGEMYVDEGEDGLLMIGAGAFTEEEALEARELFDQILPTLRSIDS